MNGIEGLYNQENFFAEWKMQKTKPEKVKWLKEMKDLKIKSPEMFKDLRINLTQFDALIKEWESKRPFGKLKDQIKAREIAEKKGDE